MNNIFKGNRDLAAHGFANMTFLDLTHTEGIQDDRFSPRKMSVLIFNVIWITALFVSLSTAGTSGRLAGCAPPRVLGGNRAYKKCSVSRVFSNSDVRFGFALRNYTNVVQHDSRRPQNTAYTESTLSRGALKVWSNWMWSRGEGTPTFLGQGL